MCVLWIGVSERLKCDSGGRAGSEQSKNRGRETVGGAMFRGS